MMVLQMLIHLVIALVSPVAAFNTGGQWNHRSVLGSVLSNDELTQFLSDHISPAQLRSNLRHLTSQPHVGGTKAELQNALWIRDTWRKQGLDEARLTPYDVLLSYPDKYTSNKVQLKEAASGAIIAESSHRQTPLFAPEESRDDVLFSYNAYSAQGLVEGAVVYANYGNKEDFEFLERAGVTLGGRIVLVRYGVTFRANIVKAAEQRGAAGVIFYTDPIDFAPDGPSSVYSSTVMMPETGTQMGTVKLRDGDPLTKFYPAVESAYRLPEAEAPVPKILVTPVSYEDAQFIFRSLGGAVVPPDWQGSLNLTYRLGPTDPQYRVVLHVLAKNTRATVHNVVGILRGSEEPDRYVVLGSHRDAWIFGAIDPSSAQSALLELTRVLTLLHKETGWRPRRSLVFCSWAASEFGLVGSVEWTEQFTKQLGDRAVAYINMDLALIGNHSLTAIGSPMLYDVMWEAAKRVPNPDPEEVKAGRTSVYDTWLQRDPDPTDMTRPFMYLVGAGSDYASFQHTVGVPCLDFFYIHDKNAKNWYPLYHSLYETFELVDTLYDPGYRYQQTVTTIWGEAALMLSEAQILPYSLERYAQFITIRQQEIDRDYGEWLQSNGRSLELFLEAGAVLTTSVARFQRELTTVDHSNPLAVRRVNDQLMMVERAFLDPRGLPDRPHYNHVILSPSPDDAYSGVAFHNLMSPLQILSSINDNADSVRHEQPLNPSQEQYQQQQPSPEELWKSLDQHLSVVTHLLHTAAAVLTDDLWWGPEQGHWDQEELGRAERVILQRASFLQDEL